jgi:predicted lipoprotein with Yx(FWY)xxD motif
MQKNVLGSLALVVALGLSAAACGGDDSGSSTATDKGGASAGAPAAGGNASAVGASSGEAKEVTPVHDADNPTLGKILTDEEGNTLYVFTMDTKDKSMCNDQCAANWPPLVAPADFDPKGEPEITGTLSSITRDDGTKQVAINGQPLYYYAADGMMPGATKGQEVGGVWYAVGVDGKKIDT